MGCLICGGKHLTQNHAYHQQKNLYNVLKERANWRNRKMKGLSSLPKKV